MSKQWSFRPINEDSNLQLQSLDDIFRNIHFKGAVIVVDCNVNFFLLKKLKLSLREKAISDKLDTRLRGWCVHQETYRFTTWLWNGWSERVANSRPSHIDHPRRPCVNGVPWRKCELSFKMISLSPSTTTTNVVPPIRCSLLPSSNEWNLPITFSSTIKSCRKANSPSQSFK